MNSIVLREREQSLRSNNINSPAITPGWTNGSRQKLKENENVDPMSGPNSISASIKIKREERIISMDELINLKGAAHLDSNHSKQT
jgi:hypothetical protein